MEINEEPKGNWVIVLILIGIVFFAIFSRDFFGNTKIENIKLNGIVIDKYRDRNDRGSLKIVVKNDSETIVFNGGGLGGLLDAVRVGDSIKKQKGSIKTIISRPGFIDSFYRISK